MFDFIAIPFGWVLEQIYNFVGSYGVAIILFTIFTKLIMLPLMLKSKKSMRQVQKLQPKINAIQAKYKNNKQKQQEEMAKLYQEEKVNPAGSCLPTLITLPIMLGLYYVIQQPLTYLMGIPEDTVMQIAAALNIEVTSLRLSEITIASEAFNNFAAVSSITPDLIPIDFNFICFNLAKTPSITEPSILLLIPILSGITSFLTMQVSQKLQGTDNSNQPQSMKTMLYMMPFMSAYFGFILPAGVGIYWITGNVLSMAQEFFMTKYLEKDDLKQEQVIAQKKDLEERNRRKEIELKKEEQRRISEENKNSK
ncbi:MAG: membrane protein insertase YidC [Clostridia bacterium]